MPRDHHGSDCRPGSSSSFGTPAGCGPARLPRFGRAQPLSRYHPGRRHGSCEPTGSSARIPGVTRSCASGLPGSDSTVPLRLPRPGPGAAPRRPAAQAALIQAGAVAAALGQSRPGRRRTRSHSQWPGDTAHGAGDEPEPLRLASLVESPGGTARLSGPRGPRPASGPGLLSGSLKPL